MLGLWSSKSGILSCQVCERDGSFVVTECVVRQEEEETKVGRVQGLERAEGGAAHQDTKEEEEEKQQQPSHAARLEAEEAKEAKEGGPFQELALIGWAGQAEDQPVVWQQQSQEVLCIQASYNKTEGRE